MFASRFHNAGNQMGVQSRSCMRRTAVSSAMLLALFSILPLSACRPSASTPTVPYLRVTIPVLVTATEGEHCRIPPGTIGRLSETGGDKVFVVFEKGNGWIDTTATQMGQLVAHDVVGFPLVPFPAKFAGPALASKMAGRLVIPCSTNHGQYMLVDGLADPVFEEIVDHSGVFSPDGTRFAYIARKNGKELLVCDGKVGREYDIVVKNSIRFSRDGKHFAYVAQRGNKQLVVLDEVEGPEYDAIASDTLVLTADGKRFAYAARMANQWIIVLEGKPGPKYDEVSQLTFSPDGQQFAYVVKQRGGSFVVLNDQLGPRFRNIVPNSLIFTPDGKRFAYIAEDQDGLQAVVLDGEIGDKFSWISDLTFSPDGTHYAYRGVKTHRDRGALREKHLVVTDNKPGQEFDWIQDGSLLFAANGRLAYAVRDGSKMAVVVDGVPGPYFDRIIEKTLLFSDDGHRLAYVAQKGKGALRKEQLVLDHAPGPEFNSIHKDSIHFSSDGKLIAYVGRKNSEDVLMLNAKPLVKGSMIHLLGFVRGTSRVAYVQLQLNKYRLVVGGQVGPALDAILVDTCLFRRDTSLSYYAVNHGQLYHMLHF